MKRATTSGIALGLLLVLFFAVNMVANTTWTGARIDLTEGGLYTISEGTRETLAQIREPITLRYFYSKKLAGNYPQIRSYADRVQDLLREYAVAARGKLRLEIYDPEPYTDVEDQAVKLGLKGAQTDSGDRLYFGLVGTNSVGDSEVIPYFVQDREAFLEYDMTRLIYRLTDPKKPVVALLTSLPMDGGGAALGALMPGGGPQPYMIYEQMRKDYDLRTVGPHLDAVDPAVNVLVIAHPPKLDQTTLYAIDQYALRGGRILAFVDPYFEGSRGGGGLFGQGLPDHSDLGPLLQSWGVGFDTTKVVGDRIMAQRASTTIEGRPEVVAFPPWLAITKDTINHDDPVTADVDSLNLASAGRLAPIRGASTTLTPLVRSTDQAELIDTQRLQGVPDPMGLLRDFHATGERYILAGRISGAARTAFPNGKPPPEKPAEGQTPPPPPAAANANAPQLMQAKSGINVIVVADADLLQDQWWMQAADVMGQRVAVPTADNANLVLDALDNLSGSGALIGLRGRGRVDRPFTVIQDLQRQAEARFLAEAQRLQARITDIQNRLRGLQQQAPSGAVGVSPEETQAAQRFEMELLQTRAALRKVQLNLRRDVERLEAWIRFVDFGVMPILVAIAALAAAILRARRRSARMRASRA